MEPATQNKSDILGFWFYSVGKTKQSKQTDNKTPNNKTKNTKVHWAFNVIMILAFFFLLAVFFMYALISANRDQDVYFPLDLIRLNKKIDAWFCIFSF